MIQFNKTYNSYSTLNNTSESNFDMPKCHDFNIEDNDPKQIRRFCDKYKEKM